MKFQNPTTAQNFVNRAFETNGVSLVAVLMEKHILVCTRKEGIKLVNAGYELAF